MPNFNQLSQMLGQQSNVPPPGAANLGPQGLNPYLRNMRPQLAQSIGGQVNQRQSLIGDIMPKLGTRGRPVGVANGMGMTPPSQSVFNPALKMLTRSGGAGQGGGLPFARQKADGIMRKYGMLGSIV